MPTNEMEREREARSELTSEEIGELVARLRSVRGVTKDGEPTTLVEWMREAADALEHLLSIVTDPRPAALLEKLITKANERFGGRLTIHSTGRERWLITLGAARLGKSPSFTGDGRTFEAAAIATLEKDYP